MIASYLVQRARFKKTDKAGIDGILNFDYMGSAEFEFGAHSRGEIRTKEVVRFDRFCNGENSEWDPDFWWDIDSDFMWFARSKSNNKAFMDAISQK